MSESWEFVKGTELLALCKAEALSIGEVMLRREITLSGQSRESIWTEMEKNLDTMRDAIQKGLFAPQRSISGLTGGDAVCLWNYAEKAHMGAQMAKIAAASMAVVEVNASMGRIVAAPTAGASGILPATLLLCGEAQGWSSDMLLMGLFAAGAVGMLIARNASISGAEGGCQAETGTAAAMAAAALTELSGGTPAMALDAAAMAIKNVMGLICDPVAGLVECPCIKRNALGATNAVLCADMALSGVKSYIPFDETVSAMKSVGRLMNPDLRETAKGGLAATPTGRALRKELGLSEE